MQENYYRKQVTLTEEEIRAYQNELLYHGQEEQKLETELDMIKNDAKARQKSLESKIQEAKTERMKFQQALVSKVKYIEVPAVQFTDLDINVELIMERANGELLEKRARRVYSNMEIEYHSYNCMLFSSEEEFMETLQDAREKDDVENIFGVFDRGYMSEINTVINERVYSFYYFKSDDDDSNNEVRLIRFTGPDFHVTQFLKILKAEFQGLFEFGDEKHALLADVS